MKTNANSTKHANLEGLLSEILFKETEIVQNETLKSFLKFKLDLEEHEANKFISHVKKINPNSSSNQFSLKNIISAIKSDAYLEASNPFENNIFSEISKKRSFDFDMSNF